jgi:hypothetical protein
MLMSKHLNEASKAKMDCTPNLLSGNLVAQEQGKQMADARARD